ncbi:MAG: PIN domain-containing protein [Solirubrobacteraceae bacterium]
MSPTRLHLKTGITPDTALRVLNELIMTIGNVTARVNDPEGFRDEYVDWVVKAENQLSGLTHDPDIVDHLLTHRYWQIHRLPELARPFYVVDSEVQTQKAWLTAIKSDFEHRVARATAAPGHLTIIDTNVLLHYLPPEQIKWPEIVGKLHVRLVIPLRVIEELDEKKYTGSARIAKRAREILPRIERSVGEAGLPGPLQSHVTIEVLTEPGQRHRPTDADEEILNTAAELRDLSGGEATIVTGDTGARLRAQALSLRTIRPPDTFLRDKDSG